jgi:hypothetical protein
MAVMDQVIDLQERMLDGVADAQARILDLNVQLVEATGNLPSLDLPKADLPMAEWLPKMEDGLAVDQMVGNYFDFAGKLMDANRSFMEQLVTAWAGSDDKVSAKAPAKAAK